MNVAELRAGTNLQLEDGSTVQVVAASVDGESVRVRYLESPFAAELVGTEGDVSDYEITGFTTDGTHTDTGDAVR